MTAAVLATLATRFLLVMLFFPFSLLDKIANFRAALDQAAQIAPRGLAVLLILVGIAVELLMPLAILTGVADRAAALVMAGYCIVTALLWKQFWRKGAASRDLFWDFLKNFALAGGFLLLVVGTHGSLRGFLADPFASSRPYAAGATP
jgi:putative oxidoreductase